MKPNAVLSFDGAWAHCRRSYQCIGTFIDQQSDKIVSFGIKEDKNESPQSLENMIFKEISNVYLDERVVGHIQDGDVKNKNVLDQLVNKDIKRYLDRNHAKGVVRRRLVKANKLSGSLLSPFIEPLIRFFNRLAKNKTLTIEQKKFQWRNSLDHFKGYHDFCMHSIDDENYENLISDPVLAKFNAEFPEFDETLEYIAAPNSDSSNSKIKVLINEYKQPILCALLECTIESIMDVFDMVSPIYSTQSNESFNSIKIRLAPKNVSWKKSFPIRMYLAVLQKNNPFNYYYDLLKRLDSSPFEIATECKQILLKSFNRYKRDKERNYDPKKVEIINKARYRRKHKQYKDKDTDHAPSRMKDMKIKEDLRKYSDSFMKKIQPLMNIKKSKADQNEGNKKPIILEKKERTIHKKTQEIISTESTEIIEEEENEESFVVEMNEQEDTDTESGSDNEDFIEEDLDEEDFIIPEYIMDDIYKSKSNNFIKPINSITPGVENVKYSCFINVGLQLLAHFEDFAQIIEHYEPENRFIAYLIDTIKLMRTSSKSIRPLTFFRSYRSKFIEKHQCQDASDCISKLIYSLVEANQQFKELFIYSTIKEYQDMYDRIWVSEQSNEELYIQCSIQNINDSVDIQQLIDNFINVEKIEVFNPYDQRNTDASYKLKFNTLPKMFLVRIERLRIENETGKYVKNKTEIFLSETIAISDKIYKLCYIIIHFGSTNSGHYIGVWKDNNKIFKYNDAIVEELDEFPIEYLKTFTLVAYILE